MSVKLTRERAAEAAERLKAFAQPQRLMILSLLLSGEHSVGEIAEATDIGQPLLSQQLAELRKAGLVKARRAAKLVHYRLSDDEAILCVRSLQALFTGKHDPAEALSKALASPADAQAEGAPKAPRGAAAFATIVTPEQAS